MPINCQECGRLNPDGVNFCVNKTCRAYLDWESQRLLLPPHVPVADPRPPAPPDPRADVGEQRAGARVAVAERNLAVEPGSTVTTTVTVHNSGTRVENFRLVVQGPAANWATLEPESVPVYPGSEARSTLRFAPPRSAAAPAGQAWYGVRAISTVHPGLEVSADGTLDVAPFRGLDAELAPRTTRGRFGAVHTVRVTNQGNVVEPIAVSASDPENVLRFTVPAGEIQVQPGVVQVDVPVRAPMRIAGRPRTHPFQVVVTPRPTLPPLRLDGSRDAVPLVARWVPIAAAAVLLVAVLAPFIPRLLPSPTGESTPAPAAAQPLPTVAAPPPASSAPSSTTPPPATTEEETSPPTTTTTAPPTVHSEGEFEIRQTFLADLDNGLETDEGADIWFEADTATERFITPSAPDVRLAALGTVEPSFEQCSDASLTVDRIPIQDLPAGSVFCVLTDEERLSVVIVEDPSGPSPGILGISFTTFAT